MNNEIDISHKPSPHSWRSKVGRVVWGAVYRLFFRYTPNPLRRWRAFVLRCMGAKVSPRARVAASAKITMPWNLTMEEYATLGPESICYCTAPVFIGKMATVSQYAYLCTASHDYEDKYFTLYAKPIRIEHMAWVCARAMVGPGVTVMEGAVLGGNSFAVKDLNPWTVYGGIPAIPIKPRIILRNGSLVEPKNAL
jgi:putative colanic acid biosynthesis acetyltransferase WcaF